MNDSNFNTFFNPLSKKDKLNKIEEIIIRKPEVQIWKKKSTRREKFKVASGNENDMTLYLYYADEGETHYLGQDILINFIIDNVQYFATSQLKKFQFYYAVEITGNIFKCEKRSGYRLSTERYLYTHIHLNGENIKLQDISIAGCGFIVAQTSLKDIEVGKVFFDVPLNFNQSLFNLPVCEVVRVMVRPLTPNIQQRTYLVGVKFSQLSPEDDGRLCRQVNNELFKAMSLQKKRQKELEDLHREKVKTYP